MENFHSEAYPEPPPGGSGWRRTLIDVLETIILSAVLFLGINAVSSRIRVESISMQPTLFAGNFVFVNKLAYEWSLPNRGDIIVFRYPPNPDEIPYIKRVVGLPGETVKVESGRVYINGNLLTEAYLSVSTHHEGEWVVPEGELFVMGDNRGNSSDSRNWGTVPLELVIGKAEVVYWPPEKWGVLAFPTAAAAGP